MIRRLSLKTFVCLMLASAWPSMGAAQATKPAEAPRPQGFPTWSEFPPPPTDVPTPAEIKTRVVALEGAATQLQRTVNAIPWELSDPEGLATNASAKIDPILGAPITDGLDTDEVEAFANRLRQKATPPPVEQ